MQWKSGCCDILSHGLVKDIVFKKKWGVLEPDSCFFKGGIHEDMGDDAEYCDDPDWSFF